MGREMPSYGLDLCFHDPPSERAFRIERALAHNRVQARLESFRTVAWAIAATKAWSGGEYQACSLLLTGSLSSACLLYMCSQKQVLLRPLYVAMTAANILQCVVGLTAYNQIYPSNQDGGSAWHSLLCMAMGNGVLWQIFYALFSPLPFRWQLPQLAVVSVLLMWHTGTVCSNGSMQLGYAALHSLLRLLVPLLVPAAASGFTAATTSTAGPEAAMLCWAYQPLVVFLGMLGTSQVIFREEREERRRFWERAAPQQEQREQQRRRRQQREQQQAGRVSQWACLVGLLLSPYLWIQLGLPAASCIYAFVTQHCKAEPTPSWCPS